MQFISKILTKFYAFAVICSILLFPSNVYALGDNVEKKDFFPIGVYFVMGQKSAYDLRDDVSVENDIRYNPQVTYSEYHKEFQDLKSYGFNTAIISIAPVLSRDNPDLNLTDEEYNERSTSVVNSLIRAAEDASLQIVPSMAKTALLLNSNNENLSDETIISALKDDHIELFSASDTILGYTIYDEPNPSEINASHLGQIKSSIAQFDANAFTLSPWNNIATIEKLNAGMNPDVLMIDMYPFSYNKFNGDQADSETPLGDLSDAFPRGYTWAGSGTYPETGIFFNGGDVPSYTDWMIDAQEQADNKPTWVVFQAFEGELTGAEIWVEEEEINVLKEQEIKELTWRKPDPKELRLQSFVAIKNGAKGLFYFIYQSEGEPDDHIYGMMDSSYHPTPLILEAKEINEKVNALASTLLKLNKTPENHASSSLDTDERYVQTFIHENGKKYLIIVNPDVQNTRDTTIIIDKSWLTNPSDNAVDVYTNENFTIVNENETSFKITLSIDAADGRVILLENENSNTTTWTTGAYEDNEDRSQVLSINGAESLTVTVNGVTEEDYDYIYIYDKDGNQITQLSGQINETLTVQGDTITVRLTSDEGFTESGVTVSITEADNGGDSDSTTWTTGAYEDNEDRSQVLSINGAESLTVTVNGVTEEDYDFIYIYDKDGNQITQLSGQINETLTVQGDTITVRLTSDEGFTESGVTVSITEADNGGDSDSTTWTTGAYEDNEDRSQVLSINGAESLTVTVNGVTEEDYDFIYIYDKDGNQIAQLSGQINETLTVQGDTITVRLTSDEGVTESGVTVSISGGENSTTSEISMIYDPDAKNIDIFPQNADIVNENYEDWIAIYPQNASNDWDNKITWAWVRDLGTWDYNGKEVKAFNFEELPAGNYEVRYFLNNSFDTYASKSFEIN